MSGSTKRNLFAPVGFLVAIPWLIAMLSPHAGAAASGCPKAGSDRTSSRTKGVVVSEKHTARRPLELHYEQPAGVLWPGEVPRPAGPGQVRTPIRVASGDRYPELHVRVEWPTPSITDLDVFVDHRSGENIASSEGWNVDALDQARGNSAGAGWEYIDGVAIRSCDRYTILTSSWHSPGEDVTVKLWLRR